MQSSIENEISMCDEIKLNIRNDKNELYTDES